MRKVFFLLFSSCCRPLHEKIFQHQFTDSAFVPVSTAEKSTYTVTAHFQDDDMSRLCILNTGNITLMGVKTSSWGGWRGILVQQLVPFLCTAVDKQIHSTSVILKFHDNRDDQGGEMSKKAPKKALRRVIMKQRLRNTILEKTIPPQTTYSLKSYRFKDRDPNGHDLPKA